MSEFYVTPYREALQWAGQNLSDRAFKTFMMLMSHAGNLATGHPGYARLMALTLHAQHEVHEDMLEIMRLDLARQVEPAKQDRYGRWSPALYQINPKVYRVTEKYFDETMAIWNSIEQTIEQKVPVGNAPSNSDKNQNQNQNQNQKNQTEESNSSSKQNFSSFEGQTANAGETAEWQFRYPAPEQMQEPIQQRRARSGRVSPNRDNAPPVPPPPHYEKLPEIAEALPSDGDEALAERIRKDTKIPIKLARALVDKFGTARVKNALRSDFVKTARKPGGALRHLLEKQAIEPDDNLSSSRVEGDYEDFIKR